MKIIELFALTFNTTLKCNLKELTFYSTELSLLIKNHSGSQNLFIYGLK